MLSTRDYIYKENIIQGGHAKSLLRLVKFTCNIWRVVPCLIALSLSKNKSLILSDFGTIENTVKTLVFAKHNRNLFYHRIGRSCILFAWILSGDKTIKLPFSCNLGKHTIFVHNDSCHLNASQIGDDFVCYPHVVIGTKNLLEKGKPSIGNNVTIGTGAVVVGNITIGDNVLIAANAFVNKDVPDNSIVIGNPCQIISQKSFNNTNTY